MSLITNTVNLNGSSDFTIFGHLFQWGTFQGVGFSLDPSADTYQLNMTFSGTQWGVQVMSFDSGSNLAMNITDTNDGVRRAINFLQFGEGLTHVNVTLYNTRVRFIEGGTGDTTLTLGNQRTRHIELGDGNDTVTQGSGAINGLILGAGANVFNGSSGTVDSIRSGDGIDTITTGSGAISVLTTFGGNDILKLAAGRVDFVDAGDGNDSVTLGASGARIVVLGAGDDTLSMVEQTSALGLVVEGDQGVDTLTFSRFAKGVTLSLDANGAWQDFGLVGAGTISVIGVENLTGTAKSDKLTGSSEDNRLVGGLGADTLTGLGGDDTLNGGRGNDRLNGGDGADTFVFMPGDGTDRITGFTVGVDQIQIGGVHQLSDIGFVQSGFDVQLNVGANLHILVQNTTLAAMHDAANFLF